MEAPTSKPYLFLDLDQTLISSEYVKNIKNTFTDSFIRYIIDNNIDFYNMDNIYLVYERPYLQDFLDIVTFVIN